MVLGTGQVLIWHRPPWHEPDVPLHYDVLYEDAALVAVVKPSGLPTMAAGGFLEHTLLALVRTRYTEARPMHRLGRHTSGIVLFARTHAAAATLAAAWRQHTVRKDYRALARGVARADRLEIEPALGRWLTLFSASSMRPRSAASHRGAPRSVLERREQSTLFQVRILTGRPHQIRIHLAYAGFPLVGDPLYDIGGVPREPDPGLPGDGGYLLHATRVRFMHPVSGAQMDLHAAPPPELCQRQRP